MKEKICKQCGKLKSDYEPNRNVCRDCRRKYAVKNYYRKKAGKLSSKEERNKLSKEGLNKCSKCGKIKQKIYFSKHSINKCKKCYLLEGRAYRKEQYRLNKEWADRLKIERGGCCMCGEQNIDILDWHHREPEKKKAEVTKLMCRTNREVILEEINKCDVLCVSCHRKLHKTT